MRVKLTDVCDFQGGSQPPKDEWSFEEKEGYIRMLQIRDFTQSEKVISQEQINFHLFYKIKVIMHFPCSK